MYPVRSCLHILPDVLRYDRSRFLAEPSRSCLGAFGVFPVFPNVFQARLISQQRAAGSAVCLGNVFPDSARGTSDTTPFFGNSFFLSSRLSQADWLIRQRAAARSFYFLPGVQGSDGWRILSLSVSQTFCCFETFRHFRIMLERKREQDENKKPGASSTRYSLKGGIR